MALLACDTIGSTSKVSSRGLYFNTGDRKYVVKFLGHRHGERDQAKHYLPQLNVPTTQYAPKGHMGRGTLMRWGVFVCHPLAAMTREGKTWTLDLTLGKVGLGAGLNIQAGWKAGIGAHEQSV